MGKKTGLIAAIVGGVVVIVLGVGGFVWPGLFIGTDHGPDIEATATLDALNSHDAGKIDALFCPGHDSTQPSDVEVFATSHVQVTKPTASLKTPAVISGDTATATGHLTMTSAGRKYAFDVAIKLARHDGVWCVSDLSEVNDSLARG